MSRQQLDGILRMSAENPPPEQASPDQLRAWFEAGNAATPVAGNCHIERVACGPMGGDLIHPFGGDETKLIIYYHGGGFVFGSSRSHRVVATNLARAAGCPVLAADYRLAPEHPAPVAHDDAYDVYQWAVNKGGAPAKIALAGDSAGGNLALATAVRVRLAGIRQPQALVLMSPALDLAGAGDSHRSVTDAPLLTPQLMGLFNACYIGDGDRMSPAVTPFNADLTGLAPTLVHVGTREILRDDSVTLVERLKKAGVHAELKIWDGMCHSWQLFAPMVDEGMASIDEAGAFIKTHLA